MAGDPEVNAMGAMVAAFEPLSDEARLRVFRWFTERYGVAANSSEFAPVRNGSESNSIARVASNDENSDLERLLVVIKPTAQWERVLIAGYWLQEIKALGDFDAYSVNQALRRCGHDIKNISRELAKLTNGNMLVPQPSNTSSTRNRFRVSREGLRWVKRRLFDPEEE
jgi:hypothetical protein